MIMYVHIKDRTNGLVTVPSPHRAGCIHIAEVKVLKAREAVFAERESG